MTEGKNWKPLRGGDSIVLSPRTHHELTEDQEERDRTPKSTPIWVLENFPMLDKELPSKWIHDLENCRSNAKKLLTRKNSDGSVIEPDEFDVVRTTISEYMNNFQAKFFYPEYYLREPVEPEEPLTKLLESTPEMIPLLKRKTLQMFQAELETIMKACNVDQNSLTELITDIKKMRETMVKKDEESVITERIDPEDLKTIENEVSMRLFPVMIELQKMGYPRFPGLAT